MDVSPLSSSDFLNTLFSSKQESPEQSAVPNEHQLSNQQTSLDNLSQQHNSLSISASERFSSAESFSLTLKTREGDNVTINFSNQASFQANIAGTKNKNDSAASISLETSSSSNFHFSIEGDLNEDEKKAINNLVKELSGIADSFFAGNVQEAFNNATNFKLDGSQLAAVDFSLNQNQSYSRTAVYESIQQLSEPMQLTKALQPLREGLRKQLENAMQVIEHANDITGSLLRNLIEQDNRYFQASTQSKPQLNSNLAALNSLINNLGPQSGDSSAQET